MPPRGAGPDLIVFMCVHETLLIVLNGVPLNKYETKYTTVFRFLVSLDCALYAHFTPPVKV